MKRVKTYFPKTGSTPSFIKERNRHYAQMFAGQFNAEYAGDSEFTPLEKEDFLIPVHPISPRENEVLNITHRNQIYGAVCEDYYSKKTIFHNAVEDPVFLPNFFRKLKLPKYLSSQSMVLKGFTVFSRQDIYKAVKEFDIKSGIRLKDPNGSFGALQYIIKDVDSLNKLVNKFSDSYIQNNGIVIEENLNSKISRPYSGGWTILNGVQYSYVGIIKNEENETSHKYVGTKVIMVKGSLKKLRDKLKDNDRILNKIVDKLEVLRDIDQFIPGLICSRYNFDFIHGLNSEGHEDVFLLEHGFEVGGATGGMLLAKNELDTTDSQIASATYEVSYGNKGIVPETAKVLFNGLDPEFGEVVVWVKNSSY